MSVDLKTHYLGLELSSPLVASPGPMTGKIESLKRLEDAGIAAVVLPSLFEEQLVQEEVEIAKVYDYGSQAFSEALSYLPDMPDYHTGPRQYLQLLEEAKEALKVPVIGSLNGVSTGGWTQYAQLMESSGADALELNIYYLATDPNRTAADIEQQYLDLIAAVKQAVKIPVSVKVGPYFSSLPNMARRMVEAGADGLVLFNRFYQPDIELDQLEVLPHLVLSTSEESRLPLRWIAILRSFLDTSLAATSGVHTVDDVVKLLLGGADVTMMTSSLLKYGPGHVRTLLQSLTVWLAEKEYESVEQMKGSLSQKNSPDPAAFERANYIKTITSYTGTAWW